MGMVDTRMEGRVDNLEKGVRQLKGEVGMIAGNCRIATCKDSLQERKTWLTKMAFRMGLLEVPMEEMEKLRSGITTEWEVSPYHQLELSMFS